MHSLFVVAVLLLVTPLVIGGVASQECSEEIAEMYNLMTQIDSNITTTRYVDIKNGMDTGDCSDFNAPCKSINYTLLVNESDGIIENLNNLKVKIAPGNYTLQRERMVNSRNVILEGSENTRITCGMNIPTDGSCIFENIAIFNSTNIIIRDITFYGCGRDPSPHFISESYNIILENNIYVDNTAPAVIAYLTDSIYVINSTFSDNIIGDATADECLSSSEGLFFRDNVTSAGGVSVFSHNHTQKIVIFNSHFDSNHARNNSQKNSVPPQLKEFGHGGGLSVRLVNSSGGYICVVNSSFSNNRAEVGGGAISFTLAESHNNNITFSRVSFENNDCFFEKCIGGGISIDLFSPAKQNRIKFSSCDFMNNSATRGSGGAISLASADKGFSDDGSDEYKLLELLSCKFLYNVAHFEGTAVGLFSLGHVNQAGFRTLVRNCSFLNNFSETKDISALTTYRVLVEADGYNAFNWNVGGGVTLLNSRIDVKGHIDFYNNTAVFGGGFALSGRCLILLYNNSILHFEGNNATGSGAAIYVVYPSSNFVLPILNRGCFIQYHSEITDNDIPPSQWETKVEFVNNHADSGGSAIFTNDLDRCKWLGNAESNATTFIFNPINETGSPFNLTNNVGVATEQSFLYNLGTDPSRINVISQQKNDSSYGEKVMFQLSTSDDVGNFRQAVWSLNAPGGVSDLGALSRNNSISFQQIPNKNILVGADGAARLDDNSTNVPFKFDLFNTQGGSATVNVRVLNLCHPGYSFDENTHKCKCDISNPNIIRCDGLGRYVYVRDGIWADRRNDELYTLFTLPVFLNCTREGGSDLPGCLYMFDDPDKQCSRGRKGDLCSQCKDNYGVTLDLRKCGVDSCGAVGITIFSLTCLFFIVFSSLALFFDFTLPNELRGFIFFAQVIGLIYRNSPYVTQTSDFVDVLVNLFGFSLPIPSCFVKNISALYVALLGLVPPLLVTITILVYAFSARFIFVKQLSNRTSIHGIVLLSLFVYKYVADTAFILISCRGISHDKEIVFQYDADKKCFEAPMVVFVVLAVLILVFFVIPTPILILIASKKQYPIWILKQISLFRFALNSGIKGECYWFSAWDIFRRLPFIATVFLATLLPPSLILLIQSLIILGVVTVHCIAKPYDKEYINIIETIILGLLFLSTIAILDEDDLYIGRVVSITLLCIPFLYALIFISIRPTKWMWDKYFRKHALILKRKLASMKNNKYTLNIQDEGMIEREFVIITKPENDDTADAGEDTLTTNFTTLREPLLDDADLL
ncbi:uncharacterized protein [Dysidea avara]|uniref:uncharacterized protein n=1 Tax=Dysidea avara TaxID=196820 RepID=UPI0033242D8C